MKIDQLIKRKNTGSPFELGQKLQLSERAVYKYLKFMKEELDAPISYSKMNNTYNYFENGEFKFKYDKN